MAPTIKLTYFNIRGLAENARLILAQAGVEYEDNRIEKQSWPEMKETTPFGQLPILEYDGQVICQSLAICRFIAKENNLAGKDNWAQAQADMIVDSIMEFQMKEVYPAYMVGDENKKKEMLEKVAKESTPKFFTKLAKILEQRGGEYFAGNELTWADIIVANGIDTLGNLLGADVTKDFPTLAAFKDKIMGLPNIKKWVETRPQSDH